MRQEQPGQGHQQDQDPGNPQKTTPNSHSHRLVAIARQLRAAADLVERGELGDVEDAALLLTRYKAPAWAMGIGADPGEIVGMAMGADS